MQMGYSLYVMASQKQVLNIDYIKFILNIISFYFVLLLFLRQGFL